MVVAANPLARIERLRRAAWLLDAQFGLPGTRFRFGLNGLVGLLPVSGDVVMGCVSLWFVWEARKLGAPPALLARMAANIAIEVGGGVVPVLGDVFDMAFKANLRNVALLEDWARGGGYSGSGTVPKAARYSGSP